MAGSRLGRRRVRPAAVRQAVEVPRPATERLAAAAAETGTYVAIGVNEIDGGTLYNTLLYFAPDGTLAGRHRKLMPTGGERTIWGMGDGSTLDVVRDPVRRRRRPDLLGELHAAGPGGDVCPGRRHLPGPDLGQQRHLDARRCGTSPRKGGSTSWASRRCCTAGDVPAELRGDLYGGDRRLDEPRPHSDRRARRRGCWPGR